MDFSQDQAAIKRRRRIAEMLQNTATQSPQGQMVSGRYVGPSITQNLAQLLSAYKSGKSSEQADTMEGDLTKRRQDYAQSLLSKPPGDSFQEKASYFGELRNADPQLAGAVADPLFREPKPNEGKFKIFQQPQPDGTTRPLRLNIETGEVTGAGEAYKPPAKPPSNKDAQAAQAKLTTIKAAKDQLAKVKENFSKLKGSLSAGMGGQLMPTEDGKMFDASVDTMRGLIQGIMKVPGLGSMSDFESKLDQAKIPSRGNYENVTQQQIDDLEQIITTMEQGYTGAIGTPEGQAVAPQAGGIKFLGFE